MHRVSAIGNRIRPAFCLTLLAISACSAIRPDFVKRPSSALPAKFDNETARYVHSATQIRPGQSGFRLLSDSTAALMSRVSLADHAAHSIDLQYYIFKNDAVGKLVAQRLLAAADRGVRVRMLLDDISLSDEDRLIDALDAHRNIQIRLFNPFNTRSPSLISKVAQFIVDGRRLNRRMHNKSFIVDHIAAIVGGRNIGNAYFDNGKATNFRDLDLLAIGPVVDQAEQTFDNYWNSSAAYPVSAFKGVRVDQAALANLRIQLQRHARTFAASDYAQAALFKSAHAAIDDPSAHWYWGKATLVADEPEKIDMRHDVPALRIGPDISAMLDTAQSQILLISPYFVPGEDGTRYLTGFAQRGITVKVLTNSLATTDEPIAQSGYEHYRKDLLNGGVQLYELRGTKNAPQPPTSGGQSSGVSLHAKAAVVDDRLTFIGSMNMDQRSKLLNTEMGVIIDCPDLARAVSGFFSSATAPSSAYRVVLREVDGRMQMRWIGEDAGKRKVFDSDPGASTARKVEVSLMQLLPIEGLL